jgi:hypothetical protein
MNHDMANQVHGVSMLSWEYFENEKQTKSNQKEVISGNMSHKIERIKITMELFTTQKLSVWIDICFAGKDLKVL